MFIRHALLLAVLWAAVRAGAGESHGGPLDSGQLPRSSEVAELQLLMIRLAGQVERLDARLAGFDTRFNDIEGRLTAIETKQSSLYARLDTLVSTNDDITARLEETENRMNTDINRVTSSLDQLASQVTNELTPRLNEANLQIYSTKTKLTSRLNHLISRVDSENVELGSRMDELVSQFNSSDVEFSTRLDNLTSVVDVRTQLLPRDCSELPEGSQSGTYLIQPRLYRSGPPVAAFCDQDMDGGGWTVIQRRADIQPRQNFHRTWAAYQQGFGSPDKEFWWGLENLWRMTEPRDRQYQLRVDLADFEGGHRHAVYQHFRVASSADGYRLSVGEYSGDAGDSLIHHSGWKFSTYDRDQDGVSWSCAQRHSGGWWFGGCHYAHLNGHYLPGGRVDRTGITWVDWKKSDYSLKSAEMKVRPVSAN